LLGMRKWRLGEKVRDCLGVLDFDFFWIKEKRNIISDYGVLCWVWFGILWFWVIIACFSCICVLPSCSYCTKMGHLLRNPTLLSHDRLSIRLAISSIYIFYYQIFISIEMWLVTW
jgi:hypothetical protein